MPKKGSGRKRPRGRYIKGVIDEGLALGALASAAAVLAVFDETVNERSRVSSIEATYLLEDQAIGEGGVMFGVMHSDYSVTELEEFIENTGSWNEGDLVQSREVGKRLIRQIGIFPSAPTTAGAHEIVVNDGNPIKTKLNWILNQGQTLDLWAYNKSGSVLTTGSTIRMSGHANLWAL